MRAQRCLDGMACAVAVGLMMVVGAASAQTTAIEIVNEAQKLLASDGESGDYFGADIDAQGGIAVIGASGAEGAYVFVRTAAGGWVEQARLLPPDGGRLGSPVALDGDTALVSGSNCSDGAGACSGAAYVYTRSRSGDWGVEAQLVPSDAVPGRERAVAVDVDGDTAVVATVYAIDDFTRFPTCAAYVFTRDEAGKWNEQARLRPSDGVPDDLFGCYRYQVALQGDTIVVGAPFEVTPITNRPGGAYVFTRDRAGVWTEHTKLVGSDTEVDEFFGMAVALDGDTLLVGSPGEDPVSRYGAVYVFARDASDEWTEVGKLLPPDSQPGDWFGAPLALDGDRALVNNGVMGSRRGYRFVELFERDEEGVWQARGRLIASDAGRTTGRFGWGLSIADGEGLVGADFSDDQGENSGATYVFDLMGGDLVNDMVRFDPDPSTYHTTRDAAGCPQGFAGKFGFVAQLANVSDSTLTDIRVRIATLSGWNLVLTEAGETLGEGDVFAVVEQDGYADGLLAPSEFIDVPFTVCLRKRKPFRLLVDVLGRLEIPPREFLPVEWTIAPIGSELYSIFMIADVSPLAVEDVQDIGGKLLWPRTVVNLCTDPTYPPVNWGAFISIREVGHDFLRIGDGFQSDDQGTGCRINPVLEGTFDMYGPPDTACLSVRANDVAYEFCEPLSRVGMFD